MISFRKLFETLQLQHKSQYSLTNKSKSLNNLAISRGTLQKIRNASQVPPYLLPAHRYNFDTATLDRLCRMLECGPEDIMEQDIEHDDGLRKTIQFIKEAKNL